MQIFKAQEKNIIENLKIIILFLSITLLLSIGSAAEAKEDEESVVVPPNWDLIDLVRDIDQSSVTYKSDQNAIANYDQNEPLILAASAPGFITYLGSFRFRNDEFLCMTPAGTLLKAGSCIGSSQNFEVYSRSDGYYELCLPGTVTTIGTTIIGNCIARLNTGSNSLRFKVVQIINGTTLSPLSDSRPVSWVPVPGGKGKIGFAHSSKKFTRKNPDLVNLDTEDGDPNQLWTIINPG